MSHASLRKKRRLYLVATSVIVIVIAMSLVMTALDDTVRFFYDPTEVQQNKVKVGQNFRLGGLVVEGSFREEKLDKVMRYNFEVTDGQSRLSVQYEGLLPDLFREGQGIVAEGALNDQRVFIAVELLAKHDENYMPKEVADSLKERGLYQEGDEE